MRKRLNSLVIGALLTALLLPLASVKMQKVEFNSQPPNITAQTDQSSTAEMKMAIVHRTTASTWLAISVPILTGPNQVVAMCDPSDGRLSALALGCFLDWLMEVTDASTGF